MKEGEEIRQRTQMHDSGTRTMSEGGEGGWVEVGKGRKKQTQL